MYHFQKNIGDYRSATMHLSLLEHGAYNQMLDWYYLDETPLPLDNRTLFRRLSAKSEVEQQAVLDVLKEMFEETPAGWVHKRIEREIAQYKAKADQARNAGKLGGRPLKKGIGSLNNREGFQKEPDAKPTANREPLTDNPKEEEEPKGSLSPAKLPTCPTQAVIDLYHEVLPELPTVRLVNPARTKAISSLWKFVLTTKNPEGLPRASTTAEALDWIKAYFQRATANDFLMGRGQKSADHAGWECDIDFLMSQKGMKQVIEKTRNS